MNGHPETLDGALRLFLWAWLVLMLGVLAWQVRLLWVTRHTAPKGEWSPPMKLAVEIAPLIELTADRIDTGRLNARSAASCGLDGDVAALLARMEMAAVDVDAELEALVDQARRDRPYDWKRDGS